MVQVTSPSNNQSDNKKKGKERGQMGRKGKKRRGHRMMLTG